MTTTRNNVLHAVTTWPESCDAVHVQPLQPHGWIPRAHLHQIYTSGPHLRLVPPPPAVAPHLPNNVLRLDIRTEAGNLRQRCTKGCAVPPRLSPKMNPVYILLLIGIRCSNILGLTNDDPSTMRYPKLLFVDPVSISARYLVIFNAGD